MLHRRAPSPTSLAGWWVRVAFSLFAAASSVPAMPAAAHGFGQRYDLPLPLSLYLFGTGMAVAVSFVIVAAFVRGMPRREPYPRLDLSSHAIGRVLLQPALGLALRLFVLALFAVTIAAGFAGDQSPYRNLAPTMVWIVFWVGLAYVSAFAGDLWALVNPWRTVFDGLQRMFRVCPWLHLPDFVGVWPACLLLLGFSWLELVYPSPAAPRHIAWFATAYSLFTWAGMVLFGGEAWLSQGEVFTAVFGTFARFAPIEIRARDRVCAVRPFAVGLLEDGPLSASMTAFVLLLLSSVLYDGLLATPQWAAIEEAAGASIAVRTAGLAGFWLLFGGAYLAAMAAMSRAALGAGSPAELARQLAPSLVPIAIGYHLAHYLLLLFVQGQYVIPLLSDPFGFGWDLFGTAGYRVNIAILGPRFAWYTALAAILSGHIAAVTLAHLKSMRLFPERGRALRAELPLTALMVAYTFLSLSILSEPIVERPAAATDLAVPADALIPEAGTGRLVPVGNGTDARVKLTYRLLGSAFHDGTRMDAADLLYAYMFAWRWGAGPRSDPDIAAATAPLRQALIGLRFVGTDTASKSFRVGDFSVTRELLIVDTWLAIPPGEAEQDAAVAPPWSTLPWHLLVLMEEAVGRGWAAFSQAEARRRGVEWLDLARSPQLNARLLALVEEFTQTSYRPEPLRKLVGAEAARSRWVALAAFFREHGHFLVTNGPYRLKSWSQNGAVLEAFRDLSYPLGVGSFDAYAIPRRGFVTGMARRRDHIDVSADIEIVVKFGRDHRLERQPLKSLAADALKRSAPECRYIVTDADGRVVRAGTARPSPQADFAIPLDAALPQGHYTLAAEITVSGNAMNSDIRRFDFAVP
jgi:hypothetical protein